MTDPGRGWVPPDTLEELLRKLRHKGMPEGSLDYVRFPYYRNLVEGTQVDFLFPYTVLLGPNGTGKSSTLHAIYGALKGNNVSHFWFETEVDKIEARRAGLEHSVVSGFRREGQSVESLKLRRKRTGETDYWETEHAVAKYGMEVGPDPKNPIRNAPLEKPSLYLDFRGELSAFDKCFYFLSDRKLGQLHEARRRRARKVGKKLPGRHRYSRQDFIRERSVKLRRILDGATEFEYWPPGSLSPNRQPKNDSLEHLQEEELAAIGWILGKDYRGGRVLRHSLYGDFTGRTVTFSTASGRQLEYSEAFAGSGEVSVAVLVHDVLNANDGALVLLDEPEVSLHPGSQRRLQRFLLDACLRHHHQVVMSTHSPELARGLPQEAIKVFATQANGDASVSTQFTADEAFAELGAPSQSSEILVEDVAAAYLLEKAIEFQAPHARNWFNIKPYPGGVGQIYEVMARSTNFSWQHRWAILDGDCRPHSVKVVGDLSGFDKASPTRMRKHLEAAVAYKRDGSKQNYLVEFGQDQGSDIEALLQLFERRRRFLPSTSCPEALVWNNAVAKKWLEASGVSASDAEREMLKLERAPAKKRIAELAQVAGLDWVDAFRSLTVAFLRSDRPESKELLALVKELRESHDSSAKHGSSRKGAAS